MAGESGHFRGPSKAWQLDWAGKAKVPGGEWKPGLHFAQGERSAELGECSHAIVLRYLLRECRECSSNGS